VGTIFLDDTDDGDPDEGDPEDGYPEDAGSARRKTREATDPGTKICGECRPSCKNDRFTVVPQGG
jgi:hypothetical protein